MPWRERKTKSGEITAVRSGTLSLDPAGYILQADRFVARVIGLSATELNGACWWDFLPEAEREIHKAAFRDFMRSFASEYVGDPYDTRVIGVGGKSHWLRWISGVKIRQGCEVLGLKSRGIDVTALYYERRAIVPGLLVKGKC